MKKLMIFIALFNFFINSYAQECKMCHIKREQKEFYLQPKDKARRMHENIVINHGSLKKVCNDCHDINNSNYLFSPANFKDTTPLCARCHFEKFNQWQKGAHGKRAGSWKKEVKHFQCIECHDPHSVPFKKMEAHHGPKNRFKN